MEIGKALKDARESKGMSLETAEENTKIRRKYLEAMEQENFEVLPGRVYVKGFIKNYAGFLGLNVGELLSAYEEGVPVIEKDDDRTSDKLTHIEKPRKINFFKFALALAVIGVGLYSLSALTGINKGGGVRSPGGSESKTPQAQKGLQEQGKIAQEAKPPEQKGVNLTLNVTEETCWMYVEVDGKPVFTGSVASGQSKEFKGLQKIYIRLGNAGVVAVECNGQKIGALGGIGDVVNKVFTAPQG